MIQNEINKEGSDSLKCVVGIKNVTDRFFVNNDKYSFKGKTLPMQNEKNVPFQSLLIAFHKIC